MRPLLHVNDRPAVHAPSWYAATANPCPPFPALDSDLTCDACIVGGGYTGLSAALHLAERGLDTVVLEAHRVGWGASGRNGGQVGSGQRREQDELEQWLGKAAAHRLWTIAEEAKQLVRERIARHRIACDLRPGVLHADHRPRLVADTHHLVDKLRREYGYEAIQPLDRELMGEHLGTDAYHGGALDSGAAHLHPLNFARGLAAAARDAGARIFERSEVAAYEAGPPVVRTANATVRAEFLVLACNGYLDGLEPRIASRVMPLNNYIIATEPLGEARARALIRDDVAVADSRFVVNYFRLSADRRLLFGGGETYGYAFPRDIVRVVRPRMLAVYPQLADARIDHAWGGTLAITTRRLPHFARLAPTVLSASGYSGHGVALATMAGRILAEAIAGTAERFDLMRSLPGERFPGGQTLRAPLLALAMAWYALRDRL